MEVFDQVNNCVLDDLKSALTQSKVLQVAAPRFSIYTYQALHAELESVQKFQFLFTEPTFIDVLEKSKPDKEFQILREREIFGDMFELRLKNDLQSSDLAKRCAKWVRERTQFKSLLENAPINTMISTDTATYWPINGFTTSNLKRTHTNAISNIITKESNEIVPHLKDTFDQIFSDRHDKTTDVTEELATTLDYAYKENSPQFIYYFTLYHIFQNYLDEIESELDDTNLDQYQSSKVFKMLYDFQEDASKIIIKKLEKYRGCILADSVGLGKTFTALSVIKYYEDRGKNVLVLCPKKLAENWNTWRSNYTSNNLQEDHFNYDVLFHTDLTREKGISNGIDLSRVNWGNYDLVVIDESHNFRNGNGGRYEQLIEKVISKGVPSRVLMLSATPVNNNFSDLANQLAIAHYGDLERLNEFTDFNSSVKHIFKQAQAAYSQWKTFTPDEQTTKNLLHLLTDEFFELLDSVTIARSRRHIENSYDIDAVGKFPERLAPISVAPKIGDGLSYHELFDRLESLNMSAYAPINYVYEDELVKYEVSDEFSGAGRRGRERGVQNFMRVNMLKRLESSTDAFVKTVSRVLEYYRYVEKRLTGFLEHNQNYSTTLEAVEFDPTEDFSSDDFELVESFTMNQKKSSSAHNPIEMGDMNVKMYLHDLELDITSLSEILSQTVELRDEYDNKLQELQRIIAKKIKHPINAKNRKVLIFTAFADTAQYLYHNLSSSLSSDFTLALITGQQTQCTSPVKNDGFNELLRDFAPVAKMRGEDSGRDIDILVTTDVISEGQNLQDCDFVVNYDIHWNPVRIIQRFGRIDRIGSPNTQVQMVNFWPESDLDQYLNLQERVQRRMKILSLSATGDDNLLNQDDQDLQFRATQLKRLQNEIVDLEEMGAGISIMDLGLGDFRADLMRFIKSLTPQERIELDRKPFGLHCALDEDLTFWTLRHYSAPSDSGASESERGKWLHPHYLITTDSAGETLIGFDDPRASLTKMRETCREHEQAIGAAVSRFNTQTSEGRDMQKYSKALALLIKDISTREKIGDNFELVSLTAGVTP
ncbi:MAG: DEAD/DEAH box helicase family protein [Candidatus Ancillula sp.]|nr:DEAD/DEAH box helicase family protein [Candidatus Ancillula sp.]